MRPRRMSVRLWQTELFVIVIVVAILILSASLTQGLERTLVSLGEGSQLRNAQSLASHLSREIPEPQGSLDALRASVRDHRAVYGDDIWVYSVDGTLLDSASQGGPPFQILDVAREQGLSDAAPYVSMDLSQGGYVVASRALYDQDGTLKGAVIIASPVTESLAVLDAVRGRLWITFWVALTVSGAIGFVFSEFIGRRVRGMTEAASAIAGGNFDQRLPVGLVPDEIRDLAESYNTMAAQLGEAFSAIRLRELELRTVVESMAEGVVAFDSNGTVRIINPEARRLLDADGIELVGKPASALSDDSVILNAIDRGLDGGAVSAVTRLADRSVLLHCTPFATSSTEVDGAVLLLADITEQKRTEEAQRRFVANASHEMRTPIAALKGLLELMEDGAKDDPEVRDDFMRTMQLEVDRLGRLVVDLLTLAQLEAGSLKLNLQPASAAALVESVQRVMRGLADRAGVTLAAEFPDGDLQAMADRDRIVQVLIGFVDNALKHSGTGDTVVIRAWAHADAVRFEVADRGPGVSPSMVPQIFDRFSHANEDRPGAHGAGLGLAIGKEMIEAHDSSIEVSETPGGGATFSFDLRAAR